MGKLNKEKLDETLQKFEKEYFSKNNDIRNEYMLFSRFIQTLFIEEGDYIIYTGNFQSVNLELMYRIMKRVLAHPWLWKMFFRI